MVSIHPAIENGDNDAATSRSRIPGFWCRNFREMPFTGIVCIVWDDRWVQHVVRLRELDARVVLQCLEDVLLRGFRHLEDAHIDGGNLVHLHRVVLAEKAVQLRFSNARVGLDQNPAGHGRRRAKHRRACDEDERKIKRDDNRLGEPTTIRGMNCRLHRIRSSTKFPWNAALFGADAASQKTLKPTACYLRGSW